MRRFTLNTRHAALVLAGTVFLSQPLAAAPATSADKGDIACLAALGKMREKVMSDNFTDPKKQVAIQNMAQMTAFFVGKMTGRHPGVAPGAIAKGLDLKSPEMYKLLDLTRCATEFKAAFQAQKP